MNSSISPFLRPENGFQLFSLLSRTPFAFPPGFDLRPEKYYPPGGSPFEHVLILSPFLDGLLAHLTTLDIIRFTNVSQTIRAYTYNHAPSFRVFNFIRFCQESHQALPNHRPHNGTNKLGNWEYNLPAKKYPYIDTNEWECACKFCVCYGRLEDEDEGEGVLGFRGGLLQREFYYYSILGSTELRSLFKRLPEGMQLTVLILDGTDVGMGFVKEIFRSAWGGAWLKELSLKRCAKIEHSDIEKWLKKIFSRNWVHGLRVLKLWGCGTISPRGIFKPRYITVSPPQARNNINGPVGIFSNPDADGTGQASGVGASAVIPVAIAAPQNVHNSSLGTQTGTLVSTATAIGFQAANTDFSTIQSHEDSDLNNPIPTPIEPLRNSLAARNKVGSFAGAGIETPINNNVDRTAQGSAQKPISLPKPTTLLGVGNASQSASNLSDTVVNTPTTKCEQSHAINLLFGAPPGEAIALAGNQNPNINHVEGSSITALNPTPGIGIENPSQDRTYPENFGSSAVNPTSNSPLDSALNAGPIPVSIITAATPGVRPARVVDSTINLIRYCRQKKIYLDIGLCAMKQECFTVRAHVNANIAQNLLAAVGGIADFAPQQRGQVVLAEKRPAKRVCCKEECELVELEALCGRCVANMTCQKCYNFYCRKHELGDHLFLLCPICGPCCDICFEANTTSCAQCSEHFCDTHYPNGRCLIVFDLITGDLVAREEDDVIAEEEAEAGGTMSGNSLCGRRNRKYEKCKVCRDVICWECAGEGSWEYCNSARGGCGEMVCDDCVVICSTCENRFCENCTIDTDNNCSTITDSNDNSVDSRDSEYGEESWLCGHCHGVKKHRDIDPLAMRALFREKFDPNEIQDLMERQDMEKANGKGWLENVLEEADDSDIPELIDSDEDEELIPYLIDLNEEAVPGLVGSGADGDEGSDPARLEDYGDDTSGLIKSDEGGCSDGSGEETPLDPSNPSDKMVERGHSTVEGNLDEIGIGESREETKDTCTTIKGKAIFNGPRNIKRYDKFEIPTEYPSSHNDPEASSSSIESVKDKIAVTAKGNLLEYCAKTTSSEEALNGIESDPKRSLHRP